jgi:endonuclease YncB( thermonuclease family)
MNNDYGERALGRLRRPNGKDLADSLITSGHVRPYDGVKRGPWCKD